MVRGLRIDELWAWIIVDPADDTEGIVGVFTGQGWMPLVGADRERVESQRPFAAATAARVGRRATLVRFTTRTDVETLAVGEVRDGE